MIDTHCHITMNDYDDIPSLIEKIKDSGVNKIIVNGCDMASNIEVLELVKKLKIDIPDLNLWIYTGYYYDELIEQDKTDIFDYIDVLVDGKFIKELADPTLKFRGSSNQRIIDVQKSLANKEIILMEV